MHNYTYELTKNNCTFRMLVLFNILVGKKISVLIGYFLQSDFNV